MSNISLSQLINESLIAEEDSSKQSNDQPGASRISRIRELGSAAAGKLGHWGKSAAGFVKQHPGGTAATAAIAAGLGGGAYIGKKIHDRRKAANAPAPTRKEILMGKANEYGNKAKAFASQHGKKVAAGTLAALGAGIGVKALLKYLRKKNRS